MNITEIKIAIIGGGPGGLTLARLLQLKGARVQVYERDMDKTARVQGGALDLHTGSGLAALSKAGLMEEFKTHYRPGAELMRVTDNQGSICLDEHGANSKGTLGGKYHRPEIDRGPLRDILLNSLLSGTVVWNSHITRIEPLGEQWQLIFQNGGHAITDLVIGADGSNSKIRPFVTDISPCWTGITMLEGAVKDAARTAPVIHQLLKGGKIFAYGNEKTLIVSSKGDGSFGFAASFRSNEHWAEDSGIDFRDRRQVLDWFKKEFAEWSPVWWELFAADDTLFIPRPQYCVPLDRRWEAKANLTLIGDAAHWMPPFAGEGVNMAMLDALQLSEALTGEFPDTRSAIARYELQMFKRIAKVGQSTLFNTGWMHQPEALENMVAMFGANKFKQGLFIAKYVIKVNILPFVRKAVGLSPGQKRI
jgi:2-polyprenyl-6-methoxyphenol hydroxylase-like FAD-dependent oxidoreductase